MTKVWLKGRKLLVIIGTVIGIGGIATAAISHIQHMQGDSEVVYNYTEASEALSPNVKSISIDELVVSYGKFYDAAISDLDSIASTDWTQEDIDKAHFCLIYADKIGDYSQAGSLLLMIDEVKKSGVDVDTNTLGVTAADREAIAKRLEAVYTVEIVDGDNV